jgi:alpha/beta superfamily hydrolase
MQPVLFGTTERRLAGLYHQPAGGYSQKAFLLCNPAGQEAVRVYRAYRELALRLSQAGAHVFRFDYSGCGDSWGDAADCSVSGWLQDIQSASRELTDTAATAQLSLIGFRLGGTLAYLAGTVVPRIDRMILVDPVVNGRRYIDAAAEAHRVMLADPDRFRQPREPGDANGELLGFEMPGKFLDEITAIDLCAARPAVGCRIEILASSDTPEHESLSEHLRQSDVDCGFARVPCDTRWEDGTALERTLLAPGIISAILERAA